MSLFGERGRIAFVSVLSFVLAFGCAGSATVEKEEESTIGEKELLEKYEPLFNPSQYDPPIETIERFVQLDTTGKTSEAKPVESSPAESVPGFRVQVLSTTEIDTANALKAELSSLPENIGIYVVYESPYYKVRVGDFLSRPEANPLLRTLHERGYTDAWIVADRVLKNPSRRVPPPSTKEQE